MNGFCAPAYESTSLGAPRKHKKLHWYTVLHTAEGVLANVRAQVSSMQLMDNYCPYAAGLLCVLVPIFEPLGFKGPLTASQPDTLLTYNYTPLIVGAIALTAVLGLLVSLSTFLVIGATSSLTYNVVSTGFP